MTVEAAFVRSAAGATDLPRDGVAEIALVGRSNVGKSSVINALVRQRLARTSAAPGKTRLANVYRIARTSDAPPFYLVDLPGYGYARGDGNFEQLVGAYFGRVRPQEPDRQIPLLPDRHPQIVALLLVDARHPGLQNDIGAWRWLQATLERVAIVATKVDKLARGERIRALGQLESVFEHPVTAVSAVTGEGLDELWKLIDRLLPTRSHPPLRRRNPPAAAAMAPAATTARVERRRPRSSSSRRSKT